MYLSDTFVLVFHTHMDAWRQMDSPVLGGEGDAVRRDAGRVGIDSKTFLCPQLQDRAARTRYKYTKIITDPDADVDTDTLFRKLVKDCQ